MKALLTLCLLTWATPVRSASSFLADCNAQNERRVCVIPNTVCKNGQCNCKDAFYYSRSGTCARVPTPRVRIRATYFSLTMTLVNPGDLRDFRWFLHGTNAGANRTYINIKLHTPMRIVRISPGQKWYLFVTLPRTVSVNNKVYTFKDTRRFNAKTWCEVTTFGEKCEKFCACMTLGCDVGPCVRGVCLPGYHGPYCNLSETIYATETKYLNCFTTKSSPSFRDLRWYRIDNNQKTPVPSYLTNSSTRGGYHYQAPLTVPLELSEQEPTFACYDGTKPLNVHIFKRTHPTLTMMGSLAVVGEHVGFICTVCCLSVTHPFGNPKWYFNQQEITYNTTVYHIRVLDEARSYFILKSVTWDMYGKDVHCAISSTKSNTITLNSNFFAQVPTSRSQVEGACSIRQASSGQGQLTAWNQGLCLSSNYTVRWFLKGPGGYNRELPETSSVWSSCSSTSSKIKSTFTFRPSIAWSRSRGFHGNDFVVSFVIASRIYDDCCAGSLPELDDPVVCTADPGVNINIGP